MKINLQTPINFLGYGVAGYNILRSLVDEGHYVSLFPIGGIEADPKNHSFIQKCIDNQIAFDVYNPSLKVYHQNQQAEHAGSPRCGFPIFELDRFNEVEKQHLSSLDKIYVCSHWAKDIILSQIEIRQEDVHVAPLGVDTSIFNTNTPRIWHARRTVFFNCGKWEVRKGHDILLDAFCEAFEQDDDVELWMMCDNPFIGNKNKEWESKYKTSKLGNKVRILHRVQTQQDLARIMNQADCGVFPSRAEGWNLELLEMMAMGKSVITTQYSAHTEFVNENNAHLIKVDDTESAYDGIWFHNQGNWALLGDAQYNQLVKYMKLVHSDNQSNNLYNVAGVKTAQQFSWKNTAHSIVKGLE